MSKQLVYGLIFGGSILVTNIITYNISVISIENKVSEQIDVRCKEPDQDRKFSRKYYQKKAPEFQEGNRY